MKLDKFAYLYSKPLENHTLKIMNKKPGKIMEISWNFVSPKKWEPCNGLFTLTETDLGTDSVLDSNPNGHIVLCRKCSHCTDSDLDPYSLYVCRTGIQIRV